LLLALMALDGWLGGDESAVEGPVGAANAAGWKGEIGLFNFSYESGGGKRTQALIDGDPKGRRMQGTVARQSVYWSCVEPSPGKWEFDQCRQVRVIDKLQDAGWRVQVVLRTKRGSFGKAPFWATDTGGQPENFDVSYAPKDMGSSPSAAHGYSESYYAFVRRAIDHFCEGSSCRIHSFVIENEANSNENWIGRGGTPKGDVDDYVRLVATARKAVDDSGARLPIYDAGLQGYAILWNVIGDELKAGGAAGAAAAHQKLFNDAMPAAKVSKQVDKRQDNPSIAKIRMMLESDLYKYTDGINFHHYQTPESIPDLARFLRRYVPAGHALVTNEVGIKEGVIKDKDEDKVDAWMIQKMVYLFDSEVSPVIWFSVRSSNNIGSFSTAQNKFKQSPADAYNAFASRVGSGVTDVDMATARAGGRELVRATLQGAGGKFAVEWFADGAAGQWDGVSGPAGCDAGAAPYRTRYLRIVDCR
jgi:hypothetical protein